MTFNRGCPFFMTSHLACFLLLLTATSCGERTARQEAHPNRLAAAMLLDEAEDEARYLVWLRQPGGDLSTFLVVGNSLGTDVLAERSGLALPEGERLYFLQPTATAIPLCDCDRTADNTDTDGCVQTDTPAITVVPQFMDADSGPAWPVLPDSLLAPGNPEPAGVHADVQLEFIIGSYALFSYALRYQYCGEADDRQVSSFIVRHTQTGETEALLTDADLAFIEDNEKQVALDRINSSRRQPLPADAVVLRSIALSFISGIGCAVNYHFAVTHEARSEDGADGVLTHTIVVPALRIPERLQLLVVAPPAIANLVLQRAGAQLLGWRLIADDAARHHLKRIFLEEDTGRP
jgi:hypothetical protein